MNCCAICNDLNYLLHWLRKKFVMHRLLSMLVWQKGIDEGGFAAAQRLEMSQARDMWRSGFSMIYRLK